jgi:hypothetical protein
LDIKGVEKVERKESTLHAVGIFLFSPKVTKNQFA